MSVLSGGLNREVFLLAGGARFEDTLYILVGVSQRVPFAADGGMNRQRQPTTNGDTTHSLHGAPRSRIMRDASV